MVKVKKNVLVQWENDNLRTLMFTKKRSNLIKLLRLKNMMRYRLFFSVVNFVFCKLSK